MRNKVGAMLTLEQTRAAWNLGNMSAKGKREFAEEMAKHFRGTPESRLLLARRLGRRAFALRRAALSGESSLAEVRDQLERARRHGRRHSAAIEARER